MSRLKTFRKKIIKHPATHVVLGALLAMYVRLVYLTARVEISSEADLSDFWAKQQKDRKSFVLPIWHSHLLFAKMAWQDKRRAYGLMSQSQDGRVLGVICRLMGMHVIFGSTSKGAVAGLKKMIRLARQGHSFVITPDGPRGPCQVAQPGVVEIARYSHAPIVPVGVGCQGCWYLKTWDTFCVPKPFCKVFVYYGNPIYVDRKASVEVVRKQVEDTMRTLHKQAQERVAADN